MRQTQTPAAPPSPTGRRRRARARPRSRVPPAPVSGPGRPLSVSQTFRAITRTCRKPMLVTVVSQSWSGAARALPPRDSGGHSPGEARVDDVNDDRGLRREHAAPRPPARPSFFGSKLGHSMHVSTICGTQHRAIGRQQEAQHTQ